MFYVGRFLQIIGLGISGFGCLVAFDPKTSEATFFMFCLIGVIIFFVGHSIIPKK